MDRIHARATCSLMPNGTREEIENLAKVFPYVVEWSSPAGSEDYDWGYILHSDHWDANLDAYTESKDAGGGSVRATKAVELESGRWGLRPDGDNIDNYIDGKEVAKDESWYCWWAG